MQGFNRPSCKQHRDVPVSHICFEKKPIFVCQICLKSNQHCGKHPQQVIEILSFMNSLQETANQVKIHEDKAMKRYEQLTDLAGKVKVSYVRQEEEMIKEMLKILQNQNKQFKEICRRQKNIRSKLTSALKLIKYLQPFHDPEMFQMKLNLSSPKGLKLFFKKVQNHSALLNKKVQGELQKAENDLISEQKQLEKLQGDSLMKKLREMLKAAGRGQEKQFANLKAIHRPDAIK